MASPNNALLAGIYTRLAAYATLTALVSTRIYDFVPEAAQPPFVKLGETTLIEWDTKTRSGWEGTVTIHAWSFEKAGRKEANTILSAIHDALHRQEANITVTGFTLVELAREMEEVFQDTAVEGQADRYWHGVIRFRALIEES